MANDILHFCTEYKRKIENDKQIKQIKQNEIDKIYFFQDYVDRISFSVHAYSHNPRAGICFGYYGRRVINLDEEDLKYLYNKYGKQLQNELQEKMDKLKGEYNAIP